MQPARDSRGTRKAFYVADLNARGELQLKAEYSYDLLEQIPGSADLIARFSGWLWRSPEEFQEILLPATATPLGQTPERGAMSFRWRASAATAGIAALRFADELASFSLLASGTQPEADRLTLEAFQQHLLRELHDTGFEPAFALMEIPERPLVATFNFASPPDRAGQAIAALADRCFAASYFRYQGLA